MLSPLLDGLVVVVTGVGPDLGRSLALTCADHGADVVLAARDLSRLEKIANEVRELDRRALVVPTDVTDDAAVTQLMAVTMDEFGRMDGLVNNAFQQPPIESIDDLDMATWLHAFEINCHAAIRVTKAAIPHLTQSPYASVVMVNTMSVWTNRPNFGAYQAAKSALASAARTLAVELGPRGVRVNSIAPGYIWAQPVRDYLARQAERRGVETEVVYNELLEQIPLRRVNTPDEIARTAVFLLSELARGVTGVFLDVNGGQALHP